MLLMSLMLVAMPLQDPLAAAAPAPSPKREKLICKSRVKTGSRTNFDTVCHTKAEWAMISRENRAVVERGQQQQNRMDRDPPGTPN